VAVASSIAASRVHTLVHHGYTAAAALADGLEWAVLVCAVTGLAAIPVAFALIRRARQADVIATTQPQELLAASRLQIISADGPESLTAGDAGYQP
jgi:hypothetical protein